MKILIIQRVNPPLQGFILLNLIYNQLVKSHTKEDLEIDLMLENSKDLSNVFFQNKWFNSILFTAGLKDLWDRKNITYDLVINLAQSPFSVLYYYISKGRNKQTLHWLNRKKITATNDYDLESVLAKRMIKKISDKDLVDIDAPTLNIEKEKLENTEKLIDWLLRSENKKPLSYSDYVFIYLKDNQELQTIAAIIKMIDTVLNQKKFKVILVLKKGVKSTDDKSLIKSLKNIEHKNLLLNFKDYNDLYYLIKFAEKTILSITDSSYLNSIGEAKKWRILYMEKKTLNKSETNRAIERINYHLKNFSPL